MSEAGYRELAWNRRRFCLSAAAYVALLSTSCRTVSMNRRAIQPVGPGYAQAHEVTGVTRLLFVSGQVPVAEDESVPSDFKDQCRLAWTNVGAQLAAAGMSFENLAKFTIFLSDRRYRQEAYEVRKEILAPHIQPAMTVVITGIYDEAWLLEIEAIAVG